MFTSHQINERPANSVSSNSKTSGKTSGIMPKSCIDLQYICKHRKRFIRAGWKIVYLPPWYLIMRTEKVETVFCDFTLTQSCPSTILRLNLGKILSFSIVSAFPVVMDGPKIFWRWRILYFGVYSVDVDLPTQRQIRRYCRLEVVVI